MQFNSCATSAQTKRHYAPQLYKVMKLTVFFVTLFCLHVSATVYSQVNIKGKNLPLTQVIATLQQQTGYSFLCNQQLIADIKVSPDIKNASLKQALDQLLKDEPLNYEIVDKIVVIKEKQKNLIDQLKAALAPPTVITGKVVDELGNPMIGVTVKIKGTTTATSTDSKGTYTINAADNSSILVFSYVGFEPQELEAKNVPQGSAITLIAAPQNLREVVVNKGVYKERQELTTSDVGIVTSKEIGEQPVSDPLEALIGRVAGLNIQQSSGIPGSYSTVRIRGVNSIANGTAPLYVVDNVPYSSNSLSANFGNSLGGGNVGKINQVGTYNPAIAGVGGGAGLSPFSVLNPDDIEDIQVLKDADATAIYGSRGANGVILITTKKGKVGETKVNIDMSQGVGQVTRMMDLLNTQQYLKMEHQAFVNDGLAFPSLKNNPSDFNYTLNGFYDTTHYTNWQKLLFGNTAHYTNVQGSISGGNANTQFMISGGYNRQTTVYPGDYGDKKGSVHLNLTHSSSDQKFHIQFTASYVNDNNDVPVTDLASRITGLAPDAPSPLNPDGSLNWAPQDGFTTFYTNPLALTFVSSTMQSNNLVSNLDLSYQILPGLIFKSDFGFNRDEVSENRLTPGSSTFPPVTPTQRSSYFGNTSNQTWNIEPQLNYTRKIGHGTLNMLIGTTLQQTTQQDLEFFASGFASDALIIDPQAASTSSLTNYIKTLYRYSQVIGRVNYIWEDKYLINITANRNGSSNFGPGRQWANFGAVGAGWIFSKEKGIQDDLPWLSFGKLRASYGTTGNDQLLPYQFLSTYTPSSTTYQGTAGLTPTGLTNSEFGWEIVKKLEVGIDLSLLKDRLNLSVNYYRDRTGNQLVTYPLPNTTGFTNIQYNLPAVIQNSGLEIELNTINIKTKDFNWTTAINFTLPQNKLVSYPGLAGSNYAHNYIIGQSIFIQEAYRFTGVNPQTGLYTFATQNTNGIPSFPQDLYPTAPITQKYFGGVQNSFSYKNLSLDVFVQFVNQMEPNYLSNFQSPGSIIANEPIQVLNNWQSPGEITTIQRFGTNSTTSTAYSLLRSSNADYSNASFLRVKNIALSYRLPSQVQQWAHARNARIYIQAQNLFTITNYLGLDPETGGVNLPPLRMITAGLHAEF